jgi:hypothetical protein
MRAWRTSDLAAVVVNVPPDASRIRLGIIGRDISIPERQEMMFDIEEYRTAMVDGKIRLVVASLTEDAIAYLLHTFNKDCVRVGNMQGEPIRAAITHIQVKTCLGKEWRTWDLGPLMESVDNCGVVLVEAQAWCNAWRKLLGYPRHVLVTVEGAAADAPPLHAVCLDYPDGKRAPWAAKEFAD